MGDTGRVSVHTFKYKKVSYFLAGNIGKRAAYSVHGAFGPDFYRGTIYRFTRSLLDLWDLVCSRGCADSRSMGCDAAEISKAFEKIGGNALDDKEKEMMEDNNKLMRKILKSAMYTIITAFCVLYGLGMRLSHSFKGS